MIDKRSLLIVDDDPLNCSTLADIFSMRGYMVDTAQSDAATLRLFNKKVYCCVLSDMRMPGMNRVELLNKVKAIQPAIPFILMTAYSDNDLILQGIQAGTLVTLAKPLDIDRLLLHIANMLNHR